MWAIIGKIFQYSWRTLRFIREFFLNIIILLIILFIWNLSSSDKTSQSKSPLLILNLQGSLVDRMNSQDNASILRKQLSPRFGKEMENSLFNIVQTIAQAADDNKIKGLVLQLDDFVGGDLPSLQYIGKYLTQFKKSGKPIYAFGSNYDQSQYYLASFADKIYLTPQGAVNIYGLSSQNLYYKELLDNVNVETHIFRVGTYKSAVEPMMRNDMSPEARSNLSQWLNVMWQNYLTDVAANRQLTPEQIVPAPDAMIAKLTAQKGNLANYALDAKLVDGLTSHYEFWKLMQAQFGESAGNTENASIYDYELYDDMSKAAEIAVVFINGTLVDTESFDGNTAGNSTAELIRKARLNNNVKALILRINSPGGSVQASDDIRQELLAFQKSGKHIVVSMNSMAASGGYWVSTVSDIIIANPNTITGSIGVFGVVPTFEQSLKKIGVNTDGVSTSPLAQTSLTKSLTPEMSALIQLNIDNIYQHFLNIVAKARNKTPNDIDKIAQGQVWIGQDALKIGLVDKLGDFDDAVGAAVELAQLSDYKLTWMEPEQDFFSSLLSSISAKLPGFISAHLPAPFGQIQQSVKKQTVFWQHLNDPQFSYVYCLNCPIIQ